MSIKDGNFDTKKDCFCSSPSLHRADKEHAFPSYWRTDMAHPIAKL